MGPSLRSSWPPVAAYPSQASTEQKPNLWHVLSWVQAGERPPLLSDFSCKLQLHSLGWSQVCASTTFSCTQGSLSCSEEGKGQRRSGGRGVEEASISCHGKEISQRGRISLDEVSWMTGALGLWEEVHLFLSEGTIKCLRSPPLLVSVEVEKRGKRAPWPRHKLLGVYISVWQRIRELSPSEQQG